MGGPFGSTSSEDEGYSRTMLDNPDRVQAMFYHLGSQVPGLRRSVKRGDKQHAKVSIRKVQNRVSELSDFERREFEEVKRRVR